MPKEILFLAKLKLKGKGRLFLEGTSIDLCSKLSLTYGDKVNHYKSVHHLLSTLHMGIGNTLAASKCPGIFSSWTNWREEESIFMEGARIGGAGGRASWDYPKEHLVVIKDEKSLSFFEIRNNATPSLLFIRRPYK